MDNDHKDEHDYAEPLLGLKKRSTFIQKTMLALPRWITPNGVTAFRALLIVPAAYLFRAGAYWTGLAVLVTAILLDFVDGALAEARQQKSTSGAFLDPLADKVLVCGTLLALWNRLPAHFIPVTIGICTLAVLLTCTRIVKMVHHATSGAAPKPVIAASSAGKLKLLAETAGLLLTLPAVALDSDLLLFLGWGSFVVAVYYAIASLHDQLAGWIKTGK